MVDLDRIRSVGRELDREVVDLLRRAGSRRVDAQLRGRFACPLERKYDIIRGERRAIVEFDAGPELETPHRWTYLLPSYGELGPQIELLVAVDQEFIDKLIDVVGESLVLRMRIGCLHVAAIGPAQRYAIRRAGHHQRQRGNRKCKRDSPQHSVLLTTLQAGMITPTAGRARPCARCAP